MGVNFKDTNYHSNGYKTKDKPGRCERNVKTVAPIP